MADWVHCNMCFVQPSKDLLFNITSCGHIYCEKCVVKATEDSCKMCASKCTTMQLSGNMQPDVEMFFQDPIEQLNKALKKCMQTWEFQHNHRRRFFNNLKAKLQEQSKMLIEAKQMMSCVQALERDAMKLKEENIYLKKLVQEKGIGSGLRPSPRSGCSPTPFRSSPNASPASRYSLHSSGHHGSVTSLTHGVLPQAHSSPSGSRSSSQMPRSQKSRCTFQMTSSCITPSRILARTPPSGGRMGTVGSSSTANWVPSLQAPRSALHPACKAFFQGTPEK